MLLKLGMGSEGTRTVEGKNETWQQSRELEIKSLDIGSLSNDDGDGTRTAKNSNSARTSRFFFSHFFAVVARLRHETT